MAKISDYIKDDAAGTTDQDLQKQIDDTVIKTKERAAAAENAIPERFAGKSVEEVAASYAELEKLYSRQGNDLGEMRSQVDQLMRQSVESNQPPKEEEKPTPITLDDLYDDPEGTINKVVEQRMRPEREAVAQKIDANTAYQDKLTEINTKYSNWREDIATPEFAKWIQESPYRSRLAATVRDNNDLDAARDLLAGYHELQGGQAQSEEAAQEKAERLAALNAASTVSGGAAYSEPEEYFSRNELLNVRVRAKQGDRAAREWLTAHGDAIAIAYEEGRVTD